MIAVLPYARSDDPALGKFISPDTIVPGVASGAGGGAATLGYDEGVALAPLTVGFHEPGFLAGLNAEMAAIAAGGFFDEDQKPRTGPANPQALNRYAYVLNNPVRYVDPTGHDTCAGEGCGGRVVNKSSKPIKVIGSLKVSKDECAAGRARGHHCNAERAEQGEYYLEGFVITIMPGKSSQDYHIADVDSIITHEDDTHYYTLYFSLSEGHPVPRSGTVRLLGHGRPEGSAGCRMQCTK